MPGYIIHVAVGKIYAQNNEIEDLQSFYRGIIDPDMTDDKSKTHYGPISSESGLNKYIEQNEIKTSYQEGYFLHLVTDYIFYRKFLTHCNSNIYDDYDKTNNKLLKKYKIEIPKEVEKVVKFKEGKLNILNEEKLYEFIEEVGKINIRKIISKKGCNIEKKIDKIKIVKLN